MKMTRATSTTAAATTAVQVALRRVGDLCGVSADSEVGEESLAMVGAAESVADVCTGSESMPGAVSTAWESGSVGVGPVNPSMMKPRPNQHR